MKKCSSVVWRFFDRVENENNRCLAVLCKLCDTQYKFFGNTTNLRAHLINKHPLQWELSQSSTFDESTFRLEDEESNQSAATPKKRRKYSKSYKDKNVRYSVSVDNPSNSSGDRIPSIEIQRVSVLDTSEVENDHNDEDVDTRFNLVRELHHSRASDEEWLEDDPFATHIDSYDTKQKRVGFRKIKREVQSPPPQRRSSYKSPKIKETPTVFLNSHNLRDEYSVFGEYVANKLRKFKVPRTRGNLQQMITTILWQAEYGAYNDADSVKRILRFMSLQTEPAQSVVIQDPIPVAEEEISIERNESD